MRTLIGGGAPWYEESERYSALLGRTLPGLDRPPGRRAGHAARRGGRAVVAAPARYRDRRRAGAAAGRRAPARAGAMTFTPDEVDPALRRPRRARRGRARAGRWWLGRPRRCGAARPDRRRGARRARRRPRSCARSCWPARTSGRSCRAGSRRRSARCRRRSAESRWPRCAGGGRGRRRGAAGAVGVAAGGRYRDREPVARDGYRLAVPRRRRRAGRGAGAAGAEPRPGRRRAPRQLHPRRRRASPPCAATPAGCSAAVRRDRPRGRAAARRAQPRPPAPARPPVDVGGTHAARHRRRRPGDHRVVHPRPAQRRRSCPCGRHDRRGTPAARATACSTASSATAPRVLGTPGPAGTTPEPRRRRPPDRPGRGRRRCGWWSTPPARPTAAVASLPRAPRLTPMEQVLPPGTRAILDWPVAFLFPCLTPEPLPLGTAGLPRGGSRRPRTTRRRDITYAPGFGGPFAAPRLLVTQRRMPTYLARRPTRDARPALPLGADRPLRTPEPVVTPRTVPGWHQHGARRLTEH